MTPSIPIASRILGSPVHRTSHADATQLVLAWAAGGESRTVCLANVHMIMEAYDAPGFRAVLDAADLVCPDGMPLVWALRRKGAPQQRRVSGPYLTLALCAAARDAGVPVGFHGGRREVLDALVPALRTRFPGLDVTYAVSPPFRPVTPEEDADTVEDINRSGARILFVGLGCPKQERWMAEHRGRVRAVMLGVGAAFDMHAGMLRQAPRLLQRVGLEWAFRLAMEPRRLWRRYARHNPRFAARILIELAGERRLARGGP
jgi:N-acetylglucosaminyldiphosphoundecaprenol N-acetyl-beta-D-mannosaminyltransferase